MKALPPSFTRWRQFTELNGGPPTPARTNSDAAITGPAPDLRAHARTGRLSALSRQLFAAVHLRLLGLAQYTVLLSPEGLGLCGVDQPFADFHDDASTRIPEGPSARRSLAGGRA
ncbi:hypothetical protein [Streptomyces sp. NPDC046988]|uniref:hypothetical protein n=1 Tax=Streptomyces sp. NPDC046988 TaxID=3154922 RepID=UPI00340E9D64